MAELVPALRVLRGLSLAEHEGESTLLRAQGFHPLDVTTYAQNGVELHASIWEQSPVPYIWRILPALTGDAYSALFNDLLPQGYTPLTVSAYDVGEGPRFTSLWATAGPVPPIIGRHGLDVFEFQAVTNELAGNGFLPYDVAAYPSPDGRPSFAALWRPGAPAERLVEHNMSESLLELRRRDWEPAGYVLTALTGYDVFHEARYTAIWQRGDVVNSEVRVGLSFGDLQVQHDGLMSRGFRPARMRAYTLQGDPLTRCAGIWRKTYLTAAEEALLDDMMKPFMVKYQVPGAAVARAEHGRLGLSRGFGVVDPGSTELVRPTSLFRMASLSKPLTAVAAFRLIESGRLALGDLVFGPGARLGTTFGTQPYPGDVLGITVQHLLEHTSGWVNVPNDPMFNHLTLSRNQLIDWMLGRRPDGSPNAPLAHPPGQTYEYLNFGYCVLGRVIEAVTGQTYEQAVRELVLQPCGITDMYLAGDTLGDRRPGEVVYTERAGGSVGPYDFRVSRMDAHGGWLATAEALVRFLVHVDGFPEVGNILSPGSLATMYTRTTAHDPTGTPVTYAKGWQISDGGSRWHDGDLPGSMALMVGTVDDRCWAVLVNARDFSRLPEMHGELDDLMWRLGSVITDWPVLSTFR
ncbi:serine hydrolase [Kitasatospora sp. NPDC057500]|uniref:serine hydrolase n=1 Tax=Kitasatospora sp. NPDC057500 TaxID=3346151 RepID=UPI00369E88AC